MPNTRESLESQQEAIMDRGKVDACNAPGMIMVICDALDDDPLEMMRRVKASHEGTMRLGVASTAQIISDLLEISQSNLTRAIDDLIEFFEVQDRIDALDD